jgi:hypothetical protein
MPSKMPSFNVCATSITYSGGEERKKGRIVGSRIERDCGKESGGWVLVVMVMVDSGGGSSGKTGADGAVFRLASDDLQVLKRASAGDANQRNEAITHK